MSDFPGNDQEEIPFALVQGEPYTQPPRDLYIPPEALEVFLDTFSGPLDLLLWLIKRQNIDILDIPIAEVAQQYMSYIELMKELRLDIAGEYLVMAAMLAEIKSRMLLPRPEGATDGEEEDPRAELIRRLQEYERYKQASEALQEMPRMGRDLFQASSDVSGIARPVSAPAPVSLVDLQEALAAALFRLRLHQHHHIAIEALSVRERMSEILRRLDERKWIRFQDLLQPSEGRAGVVVNFLAILELVREAMLELVYEEPFAPVYLKSIA